ALQSRLPIEAVIVSEELARKVKAKKLIAELEQAADRLVLVSESLLASVSYTKTPQGIVLLAAHPQIDETTFKTRQPQSPPASSQRSLRRILFQPRPCAARWGRPFAYQSGPGLATRK